MRPSPIFLGILAVTVLGGVLAAFGDTTTISSRKYDPLIIIGVVLLVAGGWVASLTLHEFGHAMVAFRGGDHSVAHKGYLSMDVRKYTDPALSIILPLVFLFIGGIPLPGGAVWIEHGRLRSRGVQSWVSLAGPLSNLGVGVLLTLVVALVPMSSGLVIGLSFLALLQIVTFILNILPIPGLDGWGAIEPYLSPGAREFGAKARPWAPIVLFAVLFLVPGASSLLWEGSFAVFDTVGGFKLAAMYGQDAFMFWK
ncbi:site-2 protease family protein [Amycolatopsis keratiniphila]|uniref:site-2 protease family protein n=1 Tax=Amycolatopsis keratiniphila TaxID=129921 RepID=UPI00087DB3C0|nr:site-2 protease family protein [Amycolatopsis keratiniphila]OLZ54977.1 site-2 protease family protein [Amycolatopsis keratiniphila subsp. nogabecina]SDU64666.1 Zn-dependent protease (includes SpoIVFB) [Amycolatopsis keratiniphila]